MKVSASAGVTAESKPPSHFVPKTGWVFGATMPGDLRGSPGSFFGAEDQAVLWRVVVAAANRHRRGGWRGP